MALNHFTVTIMTKDNRTQASGYDPKFFDSLQAQIKNIIEDLDNADKLFGDKVMMVAVAEREEGKPASGIAFNSIAEAREMFEKLLPYEIVEGEE